VIAKQFSIILAVTFLSYELSSVFHIPIPYNVIGFIILFFALCSGIIKEHHIDRVCDFIIKYMALFFVVPIVGVIEYVDLFKTQFVEILLPLIVSILLGLFVAGKVTDFLVERGKQRN
jgi:holin-like protein